MSLESTTTIAGLVAANPTAGDPFSQGDDHLRLIKTVLKAAFPGAAAAGFTIPITATEAELNFVHGVTSAVQTQIDAAAARIPVGIIAMWSGTSAPTGWRLCNGVAGAPDLRDKFILGLGTTYPTIGATGGTADAVIVAHTHTATSTPNITGLTTSATTHTHSTGGNLTDHTHTYQAVVSGGATLAAGSGYTLAPATSGTISAGHTHDIAASGSHTHDITGIMTVATTVATATSGVSGTDKNLPPYYVLAFIQKT
jgi:microcystin-dependent protein